MHIPSGEGICTCVVQYFSMVLYNDFLGQIVAIGLLNSCVSVSTCITCPYTHIRYIAQMPSPEGICTVQLRDSYLGTVEESENIRAVHEFFGHHARSEGRCGCKAVFKS